jgi:NCS1 family nucleobase:cation symporter-1
VRRRELQIEDLYLPDGVYRGWNWRAIGATTLGCALAWSGLVLPPLKPLYDYAWFVGFFAAGGAYLALTLVPRGQRGQLSPAESRVR